MDLLPDISRVHGALQAISDRQKVNSANLSNAHTPGYTAREVHFADLLNADNPFETQLSRKMGSKLTEAGTTTGTPVDIQKELIEMQKNMLFYSMVTRRTSSIFTHLKTASQVGR